MGIIPSPRSAFGLGALWRAEQGADAEAAEIQEADALTGRQRPSPPSATPSNSTTPLSPTGVGGEAAEQEAPAQGPRLKCCKRRPQ